MLIGIISDVHDNLRHLDKAIQYFNKQNIDILLHAGDWSAPFTLEMYKQLKCPVKGVLGNADPDIEKFKYQLQNLFQGLELELSERFLDLKLDNKRIAVFHGNDFAQKHDWYAEVSVAKYFARVIYNINRGLSISKLLE